MIIRQAGKKENKNLNTRNIMEQGREIKALPSENIVFLKKINLENTYSSDIVCYARKISPQYTIVPKKNRQDILFFGYDEDEYPSDALDQGILRELQKKFPNAQCHTSLIMFDAEVENQRRLSEALKLEKTKLVIEYAPTSLPSVVLLDPVMRKRIYVLHNPYNDGKKTLNTFIQLISDNVAEYRHLCELMNGTYVSFEEVLESVKP